MRQIIVIYFLFASLAFAQRQSVVVLPSLADSESKIDPKQLEVLTEDVRTIVTRTLPQKDFNLLKQDIVKEALGDEAFVNACEEGTCVGDLVKKVQANFGARCDVYTVNNRLYLKFELYGTLKGQNEAGTIAQFNEPVQNFEEMQAIIKKEVPAMFDNIAKVTPATPFVLGGISDLRSADGGYEFSDQKFYLVNIITEPEGAVLSFNGLPDTRCSKTPCKTELAEGGVRIIANLEQYERADTTVSITQNNQNINIRLKANFGILNIEAAYSDNIGSYQRWNLTINDKTYNSLNNRLSSGTYDVKLSHECYEDINFKAGINKNKTEFFNMKEHLKLKQGGLSLRAEQDGDPVSEPVFVNGKRIGETPFSGSVPVCSEVKIGKEKVNVNVKLEYKQTVRHTHKMPDSKERRKRMEDEQKKMEEERKIAEEDEKKRTAWEVGITGPISYGKSFNLNEIESYYKSLAGQWPGLNFEFYKQNIKFFRFGFCFEVGLVYIDEDAFREMRNIPADTKIDREGTRLKTNAFVRLYPTNFLFLSGGAGLDFYTYEQDKFATSVFPVGGGIVLPLTSNPKPRGNVGFVVEALYNRVLLKERTTGYISINAGFKLTTE